MICLVWQLLDIIEVRRICPQSHDYDTFTTQYLQLNLYRHKIIWCNCLILIFVCNFTSLLYLIWKVTSGKIVEAKTCHFNRSVTILIIYEVKICQMPIRQLSLYSTDDGSRQEFFFHVGGKKIILKFLGRLVSEERKIKKGKFDRFSVKMAIFLRKKDRSSKVNPACRRKKKLTYGYFFLVGHNSST